MTADAHADQRRNALHCSALRLLDALRAQAAQSPWGVASNGRILDEPRLRAMEEMYLPD